MQRLLRLLIFIIGCLQAHAYTDNASHSSPDGKFSLFNIGDTAYENHYFEIRANDGTVIYSSQKSGDFEFDTYINAIRWTPDSKFVLFWVHYAKKDSTCIFSADDREFKLLADEDNDTWVVPIRWTSPRSFAVEVSGPHGHNAVMDWWHYRETYHVSSRPFKIERVYKGPLIHNDKISFPDTSLKAEQGAAANPLPLRVTFSRPPFFSIHITPELARLIGVAELGVRHK